MDKAQSLENTIVGKRYKVIKRIGGGSFGEIYTGISFHFL